MWLKHENERNRALPLMRVDFNWTWDILVSWIWLYWNGKWFWLDDLEWSKEANGERAIQQIRHFIDDDDGIILMFLLSYTLKGPGISRDMCEDDECFGFDSYIDGIFHRKCKNHRLGLVGGLSCHFILFSRTMTS